jgi:hypothetical protein
MSIASRFFLVSGLLGLSCAVLLGQHGSHGGMHSAAVSAPHVAGATVHSPTAFAPTTAPGYPSASAYASAPGGNPAYNRTSSFGPFRTPFQRSRYNRFLPYGYLAAPYFPLWDYSDDNGYSGYPAYSAGYDQPAPMPDENVLGEQIAQLSAQVNDLQSQIGQKAPTDSPSTSTQQTTQPPSPPLTVVLTNGQTLQIQNYAVMGSVLWDLSSQPVRKIPLSTIDIPASTKATEANGTEFPQLSGTPKSPSE